MKKSRSIRHCITIPSRSFVYLPEEISLTKLLMSTGCYSTTWVPYCTVTVISTNLKENEQVNNPLKRLFYYKLTSGFLSTLRCVCFYIPVLTRFFSLCSSLRDPPVFSDLFVDSPSNVHLKNVMCSISVLENQVLVSSVVLVAL